MERPTFPAWSGDATAEAERVVAWLRLPAVALIALGESIGPNEQRTWFLLMLALFAAWSAGVLAYVHLRRVGDRFAIVATATGIRKNASRACEYAPPDRTASTPIATMSIAVATIANRSPTRRRWT